MTLHMLESQRLAAMSKDVGFEMKGEMFINFCYATKKTSWDNGHLQECLQKVSKAK